jgi:hypothetical protein
MITTLLNECLFWGKGLRYTLFWLEHLRSAFDLKCYTPQNLQENTGACARAYACELGVGKF